jgi:GNAT superfamily N-acetyltransferase
MDPSGYDYKEFESPLPFRRDPDLDAWTRRLKRLPSAALVMREATATGQDGRRLWDLQFTCVPIVPQLIRENVSMISKRRVLIAEIDGVHVGFCMSSPGARKTDPLFVHVIAVVPEARRRGAGLALLTAAAERDSDRDIALATQDRNIAARALNERFALSIGAGIERVPLGTYPDRELGITRGIGYRSWLIRRFTLER